MKAFLIFYTLFVFTISVFSQEKIIILHPVVGDTISFQEKMDYFLFKDIVDSNYQYGLIFFIDDDYYLVSYNDHDSLIIELDSMKIFEYHSNIDKLYNYYSSQSNIDSNQTKIDIFSPDYNSQSINTNYLSPEMIKKIEKDSRRHRYLNNEADLNGLKGQEKENFINSVGYGDVNFKKKK